MAPSRRRSTFFAAGLLALAAAASPAAALSITPGALSSFSITGGQQLGEGLQSSAQQCLDACFGVANCNAASFCVNAAGCEGGKPANTCVWFKVDDAFNPPGDASGNWQSGTISTAQPQQQQQAVVQDAPVQQQVYYNNNNAAARPVAAAATTAAVTTAVVTANRNPVPVVVPPVVRPAVVAPIRPPVVVPIHHSPVGRRMMSAA